MRLAGKVLDDRCSGIAFMREAPRVAPVRLRRKWVPFSKSFIAWAVMQPKREMVFGSIEWVWRPVATFREREAAEEFLRNFG